MKRYFSVWKQLTLNSFQTSLQSRFGASVFLIGKFLRFFLTLFFIVIIASKTNIISGYNLWQMVLFFATFNLIDVGAQFFFREVYRFRSYILKGEFDYVLVSPISPLFRSLLGGADILDFPSLIISIILIIVATQHLSSVSIPGVISYVFLVFNAFLIASAFHIFVLGMGIITTVVDNILWFYRDLSQMGRFPVDIYREPIRALITFVLPVGIMTTFPGKALMGLLSLQGLALAFAIGATSFSLSFLFWKYSLKQYSSASS